MSVAGERGETIHPSRLSYRDGRLCLDGEPLRERVPFWVTYVGEYSKPAEPIAGPPPPSASDSEVPE